MHPSGICHGSAARPPSRADTKFSPLVSPIDETSASQIVESDAAIIDAAVKHAYGAYMKHLDATVAKRLEWLNAAADAIDKIEAELVRSLIRDIGKPRRAATFEAKRAGAFIRACAAQLPHINGEVLPLDTAPTGAGRFGFTTRIPYGVVAAITPFNGPVNLLVQKIAPAIAVGNAVVVKPSPPGTEVALLIADAVKKAGVPDGLFNVVPGGRQTAQILVAHPLVAAVTATGSTKMGNELARAAGAKKFVGELGSNAANIVCADADLADAATRIAGAGFEASGQQCISAQRVIVERAVYEKFLELFVAAANKLKVGDPGRCRDRRRPDGEPRGRRSRRGDGGGRGRQGRQARAQARAQRLHPRPGDRRGRAAGRAADGRGGVRPGGGGAAGRQCRRGDRARQFVGVRPAGRLLHQEPRDRVQGVAAASRRLAVDQRRQPLPPRHVSVRRRRLLRLRPRGRALRHGGIVAVEVHRDAGYTVIRWRQTTIATQETIRRKGSRNVASPHNPPFRADHVGSLRRPQSLVDARSRYRKKEIGKDELAKAEDDAIREVVALQESLGLKSITDGEFRRQNYIIDFYFKAFGRDGIGFEPGQFYHRNDKGEKLPAEQMVVKAKAQLVGPDLRRAFLVPEVGDQTDGEDHRAVAADPALPGRQ